MRSKVLGVPITGTLAASMLALLVLAAVLITGLSSVVASAFAGSIHENQPQEQIARLMTEHDEQLKTYQQRIEGRSIFFKPPPKPPKYVPPPPPPPPDEKPLEPEEEKIPPIYEGPSPAFVIGDTIWFNAPSVNQKYLQVRLGEEKAGVSVISVENMPWTVKLGYKKGVYDVKIFGAQDTSVFFAGSQSPVRMLPGMLPVPNIPPPAEEADPTAATGAQTPGVGLTAEEAAAARDRANAEMAGRRRGVAVPAEEGDNDEEIDDDVPADDDAEAAGEEDDVDDGEEEVDPPDAETDDPTAPTAPTPAAEEPAADDPTAPPAAPGTPSPGEPQPEPGAPQPPEAGPTSPASASPPLASPDDAA